MKKFLILVLVIMVIPVVLLFSGCQSTEYQPISDSSRFVFIEKTASYLVCYDKYTKVMYAVSYGGYNEGGFTVLVDADGNPLLYQGE